MKDPDSPIIAKFRSGENPAGVGCLMQGKHSQYVVLAPDILALRRVMATLEPGLVLDEAKCKTAKLMPLGEYKFGTP